MSALGEASQAEADSALDDLEAQGILNHYEDAYLNLAKYSYALKYGASTEQMRYLKAAIGESMADPDFESVLDYRAARDARRSLAQLQLQNAYFGEALDTLALMRLRNDDEGVELFRETREQLEAFRTNDAAYSVAGQLNDNGTWVISLFKTRFRFDELDGAVDDLKLRCQGQYVSFDFDPDIQYNVSPSAGDCTLEVIGDPGTSFTLVQAN